MLAGDLYIADDPELAAEARRAARLLDEYNRSAADDATERRRILGELLASFGADSDRRRSWSGRYSRPARQRRGCRQPSESHPPPE